MFNSPTNTYLLESLAELTRKGAIHTAREISQQPALWRTIWAWVAEQKEELGAFLEEAYTYENLDIILTGAGTSAYIGNSLQGPFQKNSGRRARAIPSTDLVSHPTSFFQKLTPTLLISFARSGNSPESIAAVELANQLCSQVYHLVITCNSSGNLASNVNKRRSYIFLLPSEADDQGLAMTGSFTCMLLAGLLMSRLSSLRALKKQVDSLAAYGEALLANQVYKLREIARLDFNRAVFLGSGPLLGTARESQLKLQELTDGKVICKYDSFLGFRHGPKVVIDKHTLVVYLFSNDEYVKQYEIDLVNTINTGEKGMYSIGVSELNGYNAAIDYKILLSDGPLAIEEEFLTVCSVLPAQILGFFKSLELGLRPDSPSVTGTITRVVEGVVIYPFTLETQNTIQ